MTTYVRDGWWCDCERSCNAANGTFEDGVSVYECEQIGGAWKARGHAWIKNGKNRVTSLRAFWLLVEGTVRAAEGADREPLLKSVRATRLLEWEPESGVFVAKGDVAHRARNHPGFPDCACEGGIRLLEDILEAQYGSDEDLDGMNLDDDAELEDPEKRGAS